MKRREALVIDDVVYLIDDRDEVTIEASKVEELWLDVVAMRAIRAFVEQDEVVLREGVSFNEEIGAFVRRHLAGAKA